MTLMKTFAWDEGGSIGFELLDAKGRPLVFCQDMQSPATKTEGMLFLHAAHPRHDSALLVTDKRLEQTLIMLLMNAVTSDLHTKTLPPRNAQADPDALNERFHYIMALGFLMDRGIPISIPPECHQRFEQCDMAVDIALPTQSK